ATATRSPPRLRPADRGVVGGRQVGRLAAVPRPPPRLFRVHPHVFVALRQRVAQQPLEHLRRVVVLRRVRRVPAFRPPLVVEPQPERRRDVPLVLRVIRPDYRQDVLPNLLAPGGEARDI